MWVAPIIGIALAFSANGQQHRPRVKLIDAGHCKKARVIVDEGLSRNPNDALANFLLSQIRNAFGDYTTPLLLAQKAVALDGRVGRNTIVRSPKLRASEAQHAKRVPADYSGPAVSQRDRYG